jgi:hypothetical protein
MLPGHALEELINKVSALDMEEVRKEVAKSQAAKGEDEPSQLAAN